MDQRKLMDNANTITDMAKVTFGVTNGIICNPAFFQTQNTVYEIVSDMSTRQDSLEDRLTSMEDKLVALQEQLDMLPDLISSRIQSHVSQH